MPPFQHFFLLTYPKTLNKSDPSLLVMVFQSIFDGFPPVPQFVTATTFPVLTPENAAAEQRMQPPTVKKNIMMCIFGEGPGSE